MTLEMIWEGIITYDLNMIWEPMSYYGWKILGLLGAIAVGMICGIIEG